MHHSEVYDIVREVIRDELRIKASPTKGGGSQVTIELLLEEEVLSTQVIELCGDENKEVYHSFPRDSTYRR